MKKILAISAMLALSSAAFCQYSLVSIHAAGVSTPQSFCSTSGAGSTNASFSNTEYNISMTGSAASGGPATFIGSVQGNVYWTVQYLGSTPPPSQATVTLQLSSTLILAANGGGISCAATETGDEVFGSTGVTNTQLFNQSSQINEIVTSVPSWTQVSTGVWQGNTGNYTSNLTITCTTTPPPATSNTSGCHYNHNVKVLLIDGQSVSNN